jgi:hypothetical protein
MIPSCSAQTRSPVRGSLMRSLVIYGLLSCATIPLFGDLPLTNGAHPRTSGVDCSGKGKQEIQNFLPLLSNDGLSLASSIKWRAALNSKVKCVWRMPRCSAISVFSSSVMLSLMASFTFGFCPAKPRDGNLAFNSRNCSSGIPTITLPSGLPEASSYGRAAACNIRAKAKQRWLDFGY